MRWLLVAVAVVAVLIAVTVMRPSSELTPMSTPAALEQPPQPVAEVAPEVTEPQAEVSDTGNTDGDEPTQAEDRVINIGEPMDPDDPSTWPQSDNTEVINIGEPMDPDDPSTWPQPENTEVINIGEPMDPDDPSTWPQSDSTEVINIGEPMDPDDPSTWP